MTATASSPHAETEPPRTRRGRWSSVRLLRLVEKLSALGDRLRDKVAEFMGGAAAGPDAPENVVRNTPRPPYDPETIDNRLRTVMHRLIGLLARIEMRAASARGAARANAPGAAEKRREAAQRRAEAKAAFVRETGLDARYMPLKRPLGQEPPPRRSRTWHFRNTWAALIEGETDAEVVASCARELAEIAGLMGEEPIAMQVEALEPMVLAEIAAGLAQPAPPPYDSG
ncbi:MAG: hypothetical protein JSR21_03125 [Proteobacteria bacterium]|nr:hypothetical protein [Pseudomonadota bacterium]